jgi:hypothetical protein
MVREDLKKGYAPSVISSAPDGYTALSVMRKGPPSCARTHGKACSETHIILIISKSIANCATICDFSGIDHI